MKKFILVMLLGVFISVLNADYFGSEDQQRELIIKGLGIANRSSGKAKEYFEKTDLIDIGICFSPNYNMKCGVEKNSKISMAIFKMYADNGSPVAQLAYASGLAEKTKFDFKKSRYDIEMCTYWKLVERSNLQIPPKNLVYEYLNLFCSGPQNAKAQENANKWQKKRLILFPNIKIKNKQKKRDSVYD